MNTTEALKSVKAGIADPGKWTKHLYAADADGRSQNTSSPSAVCWCLEGALMHFGENHDGAWRVLMGLVKERGFKSIPEFNDTPRRKQIDIIELLDEAIVAAEKDSG